MRKHVIARLDSPLLTLLLAAIVASAFTFGLLRRGGFNPSSFVTAGDKFCDVARVPPNLFVLKHSDGFDGQFYYRLALDPFTSQRTEFGITLDAPPVRQQRILYPLLARALSLGDARLVPAALILINVCALCFLGWLGGVFAQSLNRHALWGILLPLYPGSLLTLARDLTELLEVSLLLASLLLLRRGKHVAATVVLVLAVLAKETAVIVAAAALLLYVIDRVRQRTQRVKWYYFAAPLALFVVWQFILYFNWGEFPLLAGRINLATPLTGFLGFLRDASVFQTPLQRRSLPELIFLVCFTACVLYCIRSTAATRCERFSWLLYTILALTLSRAIWVEDWTYLRALTEFSVIGTIIVLGSDTKIRIPVFSGSLLFWLFLFIRLLRHGD
jgi:uncharacterized membrane protein YeiH